MHVQALFALLTVMGMSSAQPIDRAHSIKVVKREVPQEHSHERIVVKCREMLNLDNVEKIGDPIFGLLGNAAAAQGAGTVTNLDCLQQVTADRAFTNAKAANNVDGMVAALTYRALERNTGAVGQASVLCTETASNPEIAAISQHQDPASNGAAATNKAITLALAVQIASIGGDRQLALDSGTFAPGQIGDNTGKGNTCDDANDPEGCIFSQNLLVKDATPEEIDAAVAAGGINGAVAIQTAPNPTATETGTVAAGGAGEAVATGCPAVDSGNATETGAGDIGDTSVPVNNAAVAGIDVGPCTDFSMTFAAGLQGRGANEESFEPSDLTNFNHGTALNPAIISEFMCDTFVNACGKSAATRDACKKVKTDIDGQLAAGTLERDQSYADAWLSGLEAAFGIQSTGSGSGSSSTGVGAGADAAAGGPVAGGDAAGNGAAPAAGENGTAASNNAAGGQAAGDNNTGSTDDAAGNAAGNSAGGAAGGAGGNNVQTFTGALNGVTATPVLEDQTAARPFSLKGDTFLNKAAALQRSCAQQHNGCADAANSGGAASVAECDAQEAQCNAAA